MVYDLDHLDNTLAFMLGSVRLSRFVFVSSWVQIPLCSAGLADQDRQLTLPLACTSFVVITV